MTSLEKKRENSTDCDAARSNERATAPRQCEGAFYKVCDLLVTVGLLCAGTVQLTCP
jgi:hypothetical protein